MTGGAVPANEEEIAQKGEPTSHRVVKFAAVKEKSKVSDTKKEQHAARRRRSSILASSREGPASASRDNEHSARAPEPLTPGIEVTT